MTNQEIKTVGQTIAAETQIGGNTAERVGGVIEGIGEALDNKDAAVGYYLATMSGSTIYINASNYRLGTGGNLRAKMPAAATTACTLTVGNANAVQLWYNGAAVSADNSWEAGEIVTIFYDGTRFMASNSQGGGGQFGSGEKIKDILLSQVLGAGTDAITSQKGVSDAIFNEIDISSIDTLKTLNDALAPSSSLKPTYYTVTAMLSSVKLKVGSMAVISDNMRHVVTQIMATHYLLDDAGNLTNEHSDAEIFFIYRSVKLSGGTLPDPAGTWTKWRYVNASVWSTTAEKIKYDNSQSGLAAENVQGALDEIGEDLNARTLTFEDVIDVENSALYPNRTGYMTLSDDTWVFVTSGYSRLFRIIPRNSEKKYLKVTANNSAFATIAFSDTFQSSPSSLETVALCAGETGCHTISSGTSKVFRIPDACTYIFVNRYTQSKSGGASTNSFPSAMVYGNTLDGSIDDISKNIDGSEISGTRSNNLMLDDGTVSSRSNTANKYNVISYSIDATKKYKVRTHTKGKGIHAIVFKNGSTVTGLLYPFDNEDKAITLYLDSSNIPSGTTTACVNGWIYDGDTITLSEIENDSVAEMLKSCDNRKYLGKNILCLGDSITEYVNSGGVGYPDYLAELSGGNVTKIGIGGARLSQSTPYPTDGNFTSVAQCYGGALAISKLVEYIYTQNFTLCDQATEYLRSQGDDNRETIARLKTVDITKFDIVTIFGGTNDWTASAAVGDAGSTDVANISGSLYYMITTLLTMNPKLKIVILTPIIRYYSSISDSKWCDTLLINGITLKTIVEGIEAEAKNLHIPSLDLYYNLGWNKTNFSTFFMKNDNSGVDTTHPYHGFKELAEKIYAMMQTVI